MEKLIIEVSERFKALIAEKVKVHEVRVFGSRARGDAGKYSDLDVLVVLETSDNHAGALISDCAWEAGFPDDIIIVPIVITMKELKDSPIRESSFIKTVYREGILV